MAKALGDATSVATSPSNDRSVRPMGESAPPAARRGGRPGWRDPRLWVGVVIVAASVVGGSRVLASADDTVQVWAASGDMGAGQTLAADDLVAERVHFADAAQRAAYFGVDQTLPGDLQLTRSVGAGELLARTSVGTATTSGLLEVPIAVDPQQVPTSVDVGAIIDVYVVAPGSASTANGSGDATKAATGDATSVTASAPAISAATVIDAPQLSSTFGSTGKRQLVVAVEEDQAQAFFALLARYNDPVLTVVRRG